MMDAENQKSSPSKIEEEIVLPVIAPVKHEEEILVSASGKANEPDVTKVRLSQKQVPFAGIFVCGGTLLIALVSTAKDFRELKSGQWWYGISVASLSIILSLSGVFSVIAKQDKLTNASNAFLLVWNLIGACVLTSGAGIFVLTSNGYFAAWGTVLFSVKAVANSLHMEKVSTLYLSALRGFGISSIVLLISISTYIRGGDGRVVYIFIMSILTIVLVSIMVATEYSGKSLPKRVRATLLGVFSVAWIVLACISTFSYPFLFTGNGYFSSWGGVVTSIFAALEALH